MKIQLIIPVLLTAVLGINEAVAQAAKAPVDYSVRPQATAVKSLSEPVLDGNVLSDPVWQSLPTIGEMYQSQPVEGAPASEKTEIRVLYNQTTFYVGVVCYDAKPDKLVISDARRDAPLDDTDAFLFILDTYNDSQNGFVFGTNSQGVEYDAQIDNEGQGNRNPNRQQGGTVGGVNLNWDASWTVKTEVGDYGWSAEFAIPLRTIRFLTGKDQTWGINFRRNIRKTNEIAYWSPLPIQFDLNRLSMAGKIDGLDLQSPGNLKLIPYVLGQGVKDFREENPETELRADAGVDIKYSVTPSLTLDLTYNTDFAQVEVDDQQVNLDRFNLFFPEKRPFFLENAGLFTVGSPGEVDLFFSRRIGIGDGGAVVPIIGGARVSGKLNKTNVGFLSMFTEDDPELGISANNYTVARVNHQFAARSAIGAMYTNRLGMGEGEDDNYNRSYAVDGRWGLGKKAQISGYYAGTSTPGVDEGQHSFKFQTEYLWNGLNIRGAYTEVAEGFNPEVGFLLRSAFRKPEFTILKQIRPNGKMGGILELRPHITYRSYWNFDNFLETSFIHVDNHWEWKNGFEVHTGINFTVEGVVEDFDISQGVIVPAGTYKHQEAQIVFMTNQSKNIYFNTRHVLGGSFGGKRYNNSVTMGLRFGNKFNSEYTLARNDVDLPWGKFNTNIFRTRMSYSFTPRMYTQAFIQYNSVAEIWSANIRFGLLQQANTGLFVVYNEIRGLEMVNNRSLTIKYSRVFDVLR